MPMLDNQICCALLGDTTILGNHPEDARLAEPRDRLPLAVRLAARRMLEEAGLDGAPKEGPYIAL